MVWVMGFEGLVRVGLSRPMGYPWPTLDVSKGAVMFPGLYWSWPHLHDNVQVCGGDGNVSSVPFEHRPHLHSNVQVCRGGGDASSLPFLAW
jgi:hypothetical protein